MPPIPPGQRHEVAELPDQVAEHERAERRHVADGGETEPERRNVECHVRERADDHAEAVGAQERDRLVDAVGGRHEPRPQRPSCAPAERFVVAVGAPLAERAQQPRAQPGQQRSEGSDHRGHERERHRSLAGEDPEEHGEPDQESARRS